MVQMKKFNAKKRINSTIHKGNATRTQPKRSANKTSTKSIIAPLDNLSILEQITLFSPQSLSNDSRRACSAIGRLLIAPKELYQEALP